MSETVKPSSPGAATSAGPGPPTETWAFIDEYGNPNLATEVAGVSQFFIVCAVVLDGDVVQDVRLGLEAVRKAHFQTGEMKSSKLGKDRRRWQTVLAELGRVPFRFYGLVVDKRSIERTSGLQWKRSFYKNICGKAYGKLMRAYGSLQIRADAHGTEAFQESFAKYVTQHHRPTLFDRATLEFVDSKQDVLVQLADILCGLLARCYDPEKRLTKPEELLGLVADRALVLDEWPPRYRVTSGASEIDEEGSADDRISQYSLGRAEDFIIRNEDALGEEVGCQVAVLERLVFERRFGDNDGYVSTGELLDNLRDRGLAAKGESWFRLSLIAPLRDNGLLLTSSQSGYKLPTCPKDLTAFVRHAETVCVPLLRRVEAACDATRLATKGDRHAQATEASEGEKACRCAA
jgi:hypothetical protein